MKFDLQEEVQQFKSVFGGQYDDFKVEEQYFSTREGHELEAIILTKELRAKEFIRCIVTFPDGGGYDADFVYQNDEAAPGTTKEHYASRLDLAEGWKRYIRLYK